MAVSKLSDVVIGRVAVVRRRLAEVVGRAADPCMTLGSGIPDPAVVFTEIRYVGQPITEISVDDPG